MAGSGGIFAPIALSVLRRVVQDAAHMVRTTVTKTIHTHAASTAVTAPARSVTRAQPAHPAAVLRQQRRRPLSARWQAAHQQVGTAVRSFLTTAAAPARAIGGSSRLPGKTRVGQAVSGLARTPFAHTLRPNLTGGAIPRSAGGYGTTGSRGARYFSHTPAAPAQVIQNVSQAMRAFVLQGKRARFDGLDNQGRKRYRTVSALEDEMANKMASTPSFVPGSFVDFRLSPVITAMSPLAAAFPFAAAKADEKNILDDDAGFVPTAHAAAVTGIQQKRLVAHAKPTTLKADGFLDELSVDFGRALRDLGATMADIRLISALGDLAVEYVAEAGMPTLRVRFPGVDAATVEALCDDLGVTRGLVGQDPGFGQPETEEAKAETKAEPTTALKFPFAPDAETPRTLSTRSPDGFDGGPDDTPTSSEVEEAFMMDELSENDHVWIPSPEPEASVCSYASSHPSDHLDGGVEGLYRFIQECNSARGRFRA